MAEGARLESVFTRNRNVGSNPTPSATYRAARGTAPGRMARSSNHSGLIQNGDDLGEDCAPVLSVRQQAHNAFHR